MIGPSVFKDKSGRDYHDLNFSALKTEKITFFYTAIEKCK